MREYASWSWVEVGIPAFGGRVLINHIIKNRKEA